METNHKGQVFILLLPILFLLIGVEHGTASRCCDVLGMLVLAQGWVAPRCLDLVSLQVKHSVCIQNYMNDHFCLSKGHQ